jgi:hypothetical protein
MNLGKLERDEHIYMAFRHFDADNSGYITKEELIQVRVVCQLVGRYGGGTTRCVWDFRGGACGCNVAITADQGSIVRQTQM